MLKLTPVHSMKDLKKDDLLYMMHSKGDYLCRLDCIDGENLFLTLPHINVRLHFPGGEDHEKTTLEELKAMCQVLKVHNA